MDKYVIEFTANEQKLKKTSCDQFASHTVSYVEAHFILGDNWSGFDSVSAVWTNGWETIATVLDSNGICIVPQEVLERRAEVRVNLVGSVADGSVAVERLTTFPVVALDVTKRAYVSGTETAEVTPSQFEQFVSNVKAEADRAENARDDAESIKTEVEGLKADTEQIKTDTEAIKSQTAQIKTDTEAIVDGFDDKVDEAKTDISEAKTDALNGIGSAKTDALTDIGTTKTQAVTDVADEGTRQVGLVSSEGTSQVSAVRTEGQTQVEAVQTEGETQVNAVRTEGGTQITNIEQRGADVLSRIPYFAPIITDTAEGSIASFSDGADDYPMKSVVAEINPKQDLHGQDAPYPPGGGKNLFNIDERIIGQTNTSGSPITSYYLSSDVVTINVDTYSYGRRFFSAQPLKAGTYTVSFVVSLTGTGSAKKVYVSARDMGSATDLNTYQFNDVVNGNRYNLSFTLSADANVAISIQPSVPEGGTLTIKEIQLESGSNATPYAPYSNICPIEGWSGVEVNRTGKNLLPTKAWTGIGYNPSVGTKLNPVESEYQWVDDGKGNLTIENLPSWWQAGFISDILRKGSYPVYLTNLSNMVLGIYVLNADFTVSRVVRLRNPVTSGETNSPIITISGDETYIAIYLAGNNGGKVTVSQPQIEQGSTATTYEPYQGEFHSIDFKDSEGNPITVYGGNMNITEGEGDDGMGVISLKDRNWSYIVWGAGNIFSITSIISDAKVNGTIKCESLKPASPDAVVTGSVDNAICLNGRLLRARVTSCTTVAEFLALIGDTKLTYELATPTPVYCEPTEIKTLKGNNNVWCDTGDTSVEYPADTKLYIDRKLGATTTSTRTLATMTAPTEPETDTEEGENR